MNLVNQAEDFLFIGGIALIGGLFVYGYVESPSVREITQETVEGLKEGLNIGFSIIDTTATVINKGGIKTLVTSTWSMINTWFLGIQPSKADYSLAYGQAIAYALVYDTNYIEVFTEDLPQNYETYIAERINLHHMEYEQYTYWYYLGLVYYDLNSEKYKVNKKESKGESIEWKVYEELGPFKDLTSKLYDMRAELFLGMLSTDYILSLLEVIIVPDKFKDLNISIPRDATFSMWKFRDFLIRNFSKFSFIESKKDKPYFMELIRAYLKDNKDKRIFDHMQWRYNDKPARTSLDVSRVWWEDEIFEKTYIMSVLPLAKDISSEAERMWVRDTVTDYIRQYGGWTDIQKKSLIAPAFVIPVDI